MSALTIQFEDKQIQQIERTANALKISRDELLRKIINDYFKTEEEEFDEVIDYVLTKNHELYKRLA